MCLWKVIEQWKCQETTRVYPQGRFCSKASTANKSLPLSEGAALKAQVDSCLHAHSFLAEAAIFASLHKRPQIQSLFFFFQFSYSAQLCKAAEKCSMHSRLKAQNQNLNAKQFLFTENRICMVSFHSCHSKKHTLQRIYWWSLGVLARFLLSPSLQDCYTITTIKAICIKL